MDDLLADLDSEQRHAVTTKNVPLAILAPAGSGKTRVIARRIAWHCAEGSYDPQHVVAVTFTRRAARELASRTKQLPITVGTFHSLALAQLRNYYELRRRNFPRILDKKAKILTEIVGERGPTGLGRAAELAGEIEWAKVRGISPDRYLSAAAQRPIANRARIAEGFRAYETTKKKRHLFDFEDLLLQLTQVIHDDAEFANMQRWRFRHFLVDEFQDTNPAQLALLRAWLGDRNDVVVVGDPHQSIFGFAGADAALLEDFAGIFPTAHAITLRTNYRSHAAVVQTAHAAIDTEIPRTLEGTITPPQIHAAKNENAEAELVARIVSRAQNYSDCAVLFRTNAQSAAFERAFTDMGIPFSVRGRDHFLGRTEIQAALQELEESSKVAPGRDFISCARDAHESFADATGEWRQHLDALFELAMEYNELSQAQSVYGFREFLAATFRNDAGSTNNTGVQLLTFHKAKGLEFQVVCVTGVEERLLPIAAAKTETQIAEERRLLYVALSRARKELHITWAMERNGTARKPSPWLDVLADSIAEPTPPINAQQVRDLRISLTAPLDLEIVQKLERWRAKQARAVLAAEQAIISDQAITALALERPLSVGELSQIPGISSSFAKRYGTEILSIIADHFSADTDDKKVVTDISSKVH